ncbi:MAG: Xaa-Pro peptidase family protein [Armatimonadota bacterium]|nr:Xaa-Pro peptidase family protein [Armatimonadota bacterium]MDR7427137.1 Xaa-Pro peptidase family protein [Armatimonadota bacterium]MDR7464218.1 Xaa-Pro peptidase family protein [Armatimonadota bacterium]MDR7469993.1 Xaa-Pro peptidase family protein [Armatimonadota bacterium]MDR7474095.1 Xaa-Pro peptidase family protein [Armatimonadota bacterium]
MSEAPAAVRTLAPRLERVRARLGEEGLDALVLLKAENRRYVTGFTGSAGIAVILPQRCHLLVDFRYVEQAQEEAPECSAVRVTNLIDGLAGFLREAGVRRVGFEAETVTVAQHHRLQELAADVEFVPLQALDRMRWRKDPQEIACIRRGAQIAAAAFREVLPLVRPGVAERDLAAELEYRMRRLGADGAAFETIVASGPRSALPHGRASSRAIAPGDLVTVDWGAVVDGYHSDSTRTLVIGRASEQQRRLHRLVREAQEAALTGLRPGMSGREADALARQRITAAGYGDYFGHGLGHGVGLAVHEGPTLSPREEAVLEPEVVVTVEPGIYLPGWGGVRMEDLVVLRAGGAEVLPGAPRELLEI